MKLELIGSSYYVNSQRISRETLRTILVEVWNEETFNYIIEKLRSNGFVNITWQGNQLVETNPEELKAERKKISCLKRNSPPSKMLFSIFNLLRR